MNMLVSIKLNMRYKLTDASAMPNPVCQLLTRSWTGATALATTVTAFVWQFKLHCQKQIVNTLCHTSICTKAC